MKPTYSITEAAAIVGKSEKTLRNLIVKGKLPCVRDYRSRGGGMIRLTDRALRVFQATAAEQEHMWKPR